ncbi:MAG: hypothetical protein ACTTGZ_03725, partial [Treponema sp.]
RFFRYFTGQAQILLLLRCVPAEQGSCCTSTLSRAVSPAHTLFSVACGSSVFLWNNRNLAELPLCAGGAKEVVVQARSLVL